jgi:hypothetical protein
MKAFTGRPAESPLYSIFVSHTGTSVPIDEARARQLLEIDRLRSAMDEVDKTCADSAAARRESVRKRQAKQKNVVAQYFDL